ncbi:MAG TPA: S8 family peptidase [Gemmatimonadaceae bacterium]
MHLATVLRRSRRMIVALGPMLLGGGCAPMSGREAPGLVASAGASLTPTTITTAWSEARTVSFALDRIDQRSLPLDRTYRHFGSGRDVTVYVFDGGIMASHPELEGRVRRGFNAFPNEDQLCNAHGTAVAGAVAGTTLGVAPAVEIVDVKMVECRRMRGSIEAIVRGVGWVLEDKAQHPHHRAIANWSFIADTTGNIAALDTAVQQLLDAGIPVVVSAGNLEMDACRVSPGNAPGVITVGSSRLRTIGDGAHAMLVDQRTPGTAFGTCIGIFAPGDSVLLPSMDFRRLPTEQLWTGTSMAAGYVSGAAALYLEAHPLATPEAVWRHLQRSASTSMVVDPRSPAAGMLYVGPVDAGATTPIVAARAQP